MRKGRAFIAALALFAIVSPLSARSVSGLSDILSLQTEGELLDIVMTRSQGPVYVDVSNIQEAVDRTEASAFPEDSPLEKEALIEDEPSESEEEEETVWETMLSSEAGDLYVGRGRARLVSEKISDDIFERALYSSFELDSRIEWTLTAPRVADMGFDPALERNERIDLLIPRMADFTKEARRLLREKREETPAAEENESEKKGLDPAHRLSLFISPAGVFGAFYPNGAAYRLSYAPSFGMRYDFFPMESLSIGAEMDALLGLGLSRILYSADALVTADYWFDLGYKARGFVGGGIGVETTNEKERGELGVYPLVAIEGGASWELMDRLSLYGKTSLRASLPIDMKDTRIGFSWSGIEVGASFDF